MVQRKAPHRSSKSARTSQPNPVWRGEPLTARILKVERAADRAWDKNRGSRDEPLTKPEFRHALVLLQAARRVLAEVEAIEHVPHLNPHSYDYRKELAEKQEEAREQVRHAAIHLREYPDFEVFELIRYAMGNLRRVLHLVSQRDVSRSPRRDARSRERSRMSSKR